MTDGKHLIYTSTTTIVSLSYGSPISQFISYHGNSWARTRGAQLSAGYTVNTYSKPPRRLRFSFSWQHKSARITWPLTLTFTLSTPWMQDYLGPSCASLVAIRSFACERDIADRHEQTRTDGQTRLASHSSRTQLKVAGKYRSLHSITPTRTVTRAVLSPGNRAKPCKFRYVKSVRNFMWKLLSQRWPRSAPYTWVPWKFSGLPDYAHGHYSQNFSWAFVQIDPLNVPTKFEVRSFTRSSDNRGTPKIAQPLDTATLPFLQNF